MRLNVELLEQRFVLDTSHGEALIGLLSARSIQPAPLIATPFTLRTIKAQQRPSRVRVVALQHIHRPDSRTSALGEPGGRHVADDARPARDDAATTHLWAACKARQRDPSVFGVERTMIKQSTRRSAQGSELRRDTFHKGGSCGSSHA